MIAYLITSLMAGLHRASWGAFKDSPYEGFELKKYIRSILVSVGWGLILYYGLGLIGVNPNPVLFFLMLVFLDTFSWEIYKLFFRTEDQTKYKIPSRVHLWKKEVKDEGQRRLAGVVMYVAAGGLLSSLFLIRLPGGGFEKLLFGGGLGFVLGICEAIGGMYKDAPFEGFEPLKFFRSPLVGLILGLALVQLQNNLGVFVLATFGADRMVIEFYKTFILKRRSGKFLSKEPLFQRDLELRKYLILPYLVTWIYLVLVY